MLVVHFIVARFRKEKNIKAHFYREIHSKLFKRDIIRGQIL